MAVLPDASEASLRVFLADHIEPGSTVVTDGLQSYRRAVGDDYVGDDYGHERIIGAGPELPGVHRVVLRFSRRNSRTSRNSHRREAPMRAYGASHR
jgi:hypothetical protein